MEIIKDLLGEKTDAALAHKNLFERIPLRLVTDKEISSLKLVGIDISGYFHELSADFIRHAINNHGNQETEGLRGNATLGKNEIKQIPEIISNPDYTIIGVKREIKRGVWNDRIIYSKRFSDGTSLYIEEVLAGKRNKSLRGLTLFKVKGELPIDSILKMLTNNRFNDVSGMKVIDGGGGQPTDGANKNIDPTEATSARPFDTMSIPQSQQKSSPRIE